MQNVQERVHPEGEQRYLHRFDYHGYYGRLTGLFTAYIDDVTELDRQAVPFGEVFGKHSDVVVEDIEEHIQVLTARAAVVDHLELLTKDIFSKRYSIEGRRSKVGKVIVPYHSYTISGYNPLAYFARWRGHQLAQQ